jgi:hypothetical protein
MRRTGPAVLAVAALLGFAAGFLVDQALTGAGRATFTPSVMLPILLVALAVVLVALAVPIARATRGEPARPVNPFQAVRVAMLAKASSIVGAAVGAFGLGLESFLLSRPVSPSLGSTVTVLATAVCGVVLVVAALVAEQLCTIRKDDDDESPEPGSGATAPHD